MSRRMTMDELGLLIDDAKAHLGINRHSRAFRHVINGCIYIVDNVGLREEDLTPEVEYHSLTHPDVRFHRPVTNFLERFDPVTPQAD